MWSEESWTSSTRLWPYLRLAGSDPNSGPRYGGHNLSGDPGGSLSVQVEAIVQADAPVKPGASFPISGWAAEPMCTSSKRAHCRSELFGTVRHRLDARQPTKRITLSGREVLGSARQPRRAAWALGSVQAGLRACAFGGSVCRGGYGCVLVAGIGDSGRRWRSAWGAGGVAPLGAQGSGPGQWQGCGLRGGLGRDLAGGVQESGQGGVGVVCCPSDLEGELVPHDGDKPDTG